MLNTFIHLRTHTNYSLSEGMLTPDYIADFCKEKKQPACAITDTSNLFGVVFEFSVKLLANGIQPIIGMQINLSDEYYNDNSNEIVLISKNEIGYMNLVKLSNIINNQVKIGSKNIDCKLLKKFNEGLIVLSGGAEDGFIGFPAAKKILKLQGKEHFFKKFI